ncbi:hypothetical protein PanWU01x14_232180 [Parasponia andersonii]|uniref:Uncharacterized protein n=1 Tax=Parasponia andersonii TaxID=3476 RepID=A0A2P5BK16_PARAD|nr:hypothetical protein PanWU01x14_232180 [Parasponia andersonii]
MEISGAYDAEPLHTGVIEVACDRAGSSRARTWVSRLSLCEEPGDLRDMSMGSHEEECFRSRCLYLGSTKNLGLQGDSGLSSRGKREFLGLHEGLDMAMFHRQGPTHEDGGGGGGVSGTWVFGPGHLGQHKQTGGPDSWSFGSKFSTGPTTNQSLVSTFSLRPTSGRISSYGPNHNTRLPSIQNIKPSDA